MNCSSFSLFLPIHSRYNFHIIHTRAISTVNGIRRSCNLIFKRIQLQTSYVSLQAVASHAFPSNLHIRIRSPSIEIVCSPLTSENRGARKNQQKKTISVHAFGPMQARMLRGPAKREAPEERWNVK